MHKLLADTEVGRAASNTTFANAAQAPGRRLRPRPFLLGEQKKSTSSVNKYDIHNLTSCYFSSDEKSQATGCYECRI